MDFKAGWKLGMKFATADTCLDLKPIGTRTFYFCGKQTACEHATNRDVQGFPCPSDTVALHVLSSEREVMWWERDLILGLEFLYTNLQSCFFSPVPSAHSGPRVSLPNERQLAVPCWPPGWAAVPARKRWLGNSCCCGHIPAERDTTAPVASWVIIP